MWIDIHELRGDMDSDDNRKLELKEYPWNALYEDPPEDARYRTRVCWQKLSTAAYD